VSLSALSFNVLYDGLEDVAVEWSERIADVASVIRFHEPTLVGLQECWLGQADDLREALPAYEFYGENRDIGEHTPIGVRRDRATILDSETFWLAPDRTDRRPAWDATLPRLATHLTVELEATGRRVEHYNVHLDVDGERARVESARLLGELIADHDAPAILTGDCNCRPDSAAYDVLSDPLVDAREQVAHPHGPFETYHGYDREKAKRIDYVFASQELSARSHGVATDRAPNWLSPSDHWPVYTAFGAEE
jgi:endonuclease/exonuclease/phosphatase family metal-dependent hydrolase